MSENGIAQKLDSITRAGDRASKTFTSLQSNMAKAETVAAKSTTKVGGFFSKIGNFFSGATEQSGALSGGLGMLGSSFAAIANPIGLATVALTAFVTIASVGVTKAAALEQQVADLSAITGIAGNDLNYLSDKSIELSTQTGIAATDIVESYKLLASNIDVMSMGGVSALEKLSAATITLSQASGTTLPEAADTMSFAINQFKLNALDADRVINTLAAGAKYGAAEIPDLAASLKVAGVTAQSAGVSIESTVSAIETLSKVGIKGAEAGTGLRNILLKLQTENIPGLNLKADGLTTTLQKLAPKINDVAYLTKVFGMENVNAAQALIGNVALLGELESKVTATSVAQEQAAIRTNTFQASSAKLRESWNALLITLGEKFLPVLTQLVDKVTSFINWISSDGNPIVEHFTTIWNLAMIPFKVAYTIITDVADAFDSLGLSVSGVSGFLGRFYSVAVNIFSAFGNLVSGVMTNVATLMNPVNWFRPEKMKEAGRNLVSTIKDFGSDIGNSFSTGMQDAASKSIASPSSPFVGENGPILPGSQSGSNAAGNSISNGMDNITGGGKSVRNVTVNIQKLVENITIATTNMREGSADIQRYVEEAMIRAVRGSEIAISNE